RRVPRGVGRAGAAAGHGAPRTLRSPDGGRLLPAALWRVPRHVSGGARDQRRAPLAHVLPRLRLGEGGHAALRRARARREPLRGVNARAEGVFDDTFTDGRLPLEPVPRFDTGDAVRMRALGFNLLRLPINWSALEPAPGAYDEFYLDDVQAIVDLCGRNGILV